MTEGSTGLVLAAGAGVRMGCPKALVRRARIPWVTHAVCALQGSGCYDVVVVVGAAADEVQVQLPAGVSTVVAEDWHLGLGHSLRAGLTQLQLTNASTAIVDLASGRDLDTRADVSPADDSGAG